MGEKALWKIVFVENGKRQEAYVVALDISQAISKLHTEWMQAEGPKPPRSIFVATAIEGIFLP